jgi:molecular chaperone GrpE
VSSEEPRPDATDSAAPDSESEPDGEVAAGEGDAAEVEDAESAEALIAEMIEELDIEEADEGAPDEDAASLRRERDEYLDSLRRLQAEFENYRKRMARLQEEQAGRAAESLVERLLPVLDALDLALDHSSGESASVADVRAALAQISSLGRETLVREGLERIDEVGVEFDPTIHDAVAHAEREEGDPDKTHVSQVLRAGYRWKGRVMRPAMVQVKG